MTGASGRRGQGDARCSGGFSAGTEGCQVEVWGTKKATQLGAWGQSHPGSNATRVT